MTTLKTLQALRQKIDCDLTRARQRRQDAAAEHAKAEAAVSAFIEALAHCDTAIVAAERAAKEPAQ